MRYISDIVGIIKNRQMMIAQSLVTGNAVSFEAYQRLVGQHQGLAEALDIINDLLRENESND